jgi:hypothetical protein
MLTTGTTLTELGPVRSVNDDAMEPPPLDPHLAEEYSLCVSFITDEIDALTKTLPDLDLIDQLFALQNQVDKGPCNIKPPPFTQIEARKKWCV